MRAQSQQGTLPDVRSETLDEGFVPVVAEPERTSAEGSVVAAYLIMWAIMVFFIWRTLRVQTTLREETGRLIAELEKGRQ